MALAHGYATASIWGAIFFEKNSLIWGNHLRILVVHTYIFFWWSNTPHGPGHMCMYYRMSGGKGNSLKILCVVEWILAVRYYTAFHAHWHEDLHCHRWFAIDNQWWIQDFSNRWAPNFLQHFFKCIIFCNTNTDKICSLNLSLKQTYNEFYSILYILKKIIWPPNRCACRGGSMGEPMEPWLQQYAWVFWKKILIGLIWNIRKRWE